MSSSATVSTSPWKWSPEHKDYYLYQQGSDGELQLVWGRSRVQPPQHDAQPTGQTPLVPYPLNHYNTPYGESPTGGSTSDGLPRTHPTLPNLPYGNQIANFGTDTTVSPSPGHNNLYTHKPTKPTPCPELEPESNTYPKSYGTIPQSRDVDLPMNGVGNESSTLANSYEYTASHRRFFQTACPWFPYCLFFTATSFHTLVTSKRTIRRYVVVRPSLSNGYMYCLPIHTYGRQGCLKPGVFQEQHTTVFAHDRNVAYLPNEEALMKNQALRIIIEEDGYNLDPLCRMDFGTAVAVDPSLKNRKIGRVDTEYIPHLESLYKNGIGKHIPDDKGT
ncbi:hypothetical protein BDV95DRAFT_597945 [Massariosphaeria phaeospora]|uniref:DUF6590 domain-containing protein n=1 Tax=Massariosphaeria phaeospora TaxID=100035 RepID=A0A7C8M9V8_9PLEO|nr:hypothetical protein BDV95DRAFT_597945 [Massariosphaeria phaeospora]